MRHVDFIQFVFGQVVQLTEGGDSVARNYGVTPGALMEKVSNCSAENRQGAVFEALSDLQSLGLLHGDQQIQLDPLARQVGSQTLRDKVWPLIFDAIVLGESDREFLAKGVELAEQQEDGCVRMHWIEARQVFAALGRSADRSDEIGISKRLTEQSIDLIEPLTTIGGVRFRPRYAGVVLATQKIQAELQSLVASLIPEWETVTVEFKRELHLDTRDEKAEFIKDVVALATSKAGGRRYLVLGWDPKIRKFTTSVDPAATQNRMEQVLSAYLDEVSAVRYQTFEWESGIAGIIEVTRRPWQVPYRIRKDIGRLKEGDMFVRHGSQVEPPTQAELEALEQEGNQARLSAATLSPGAT